MVGAASGLAQAAHWTSSVSRQRAEELERALSVVGATEAGLGHEQLGCSAVAVALELGGHGRLVTDHRELVCVLEVERSSTLIGSPQQIIEKVGRYHEQLGHEVMHVAAETPGLTAAQHRRSLERFQAEVAPELRRAFPARPQETDPAALTPPLDRSLASH